MRRTRHSTTRLHVAQPPHRPRRRPPPPAPRWPARRGPSTQCSDPDQRPQRTAPTAFTERDQQRATSARASHVSRWPMQRNSGGAEGARDRVRLALRDHERSRSTIVCHREAARHRPIRHRLHPRGPGARSVHRRHYHPDLPDLHLRAGRAGRAQGLRVRPHAQPDARRAGRQHRRHRRRPRRASRLPRAWRRPAR